MKHYYLKRIDQKQCTRWPQLGDPTFFLNVTITRAKYLYEKEEKNLSRRMERYYEECAMGLVDNEDDITIEKILHDRRGEVILIEGDPGCGKTTLTMQICMQWALDKLMTNDIFILVPLRSYELVTTATSNHLFELLENLGCPLPGMKEYAQQNNGEGLVLLLDGWDELPSQLQSLSLFSDIALGKNNMFFKSTIVVTSRPSCSEKIAKVVQQRKAHYQILGFSPHNSELFIKHYFSDDSQSADLLIAMLRGQEYLRRHFYIPITVAIMCYVYSHSDNDQIPETLSKLYEHFVLLYVISNVPETCHQDIQEFNTLSDIPKALKPVFSKLCKSAYDMLRDNKLVFDANMLGITKNDFRSLRLDTEQFDGLGLLHVEFFPTKWATTKRFYSFIHRAVQELLAAIFILDTGNISDILDEHFYEGSFLINIFPFLFGLLSEELLRPLARKLIQKFNNSNRNCDLLSSILYCLFEARNETLCQDFGQVFSEKRDIDLHLRTLLDFHYAYYFISVCGIQRLNINILCGWDDVLCDDCFEIMKKYLQTTSINIASFQFEALGELSQQGMEQFTQILSAQSNIVLLELSCFYCKPGCVTVLCDCICKHNPQITKLQLPDAELSVKDLESIGSLIMTCLFLKSLYMICSPSEGVCLDSSQSLYRALYKTKSLQTLVLCSWFSKFPKDDSKVLGDIIRQNHSLKEICIGVATADCLDYVLNGLSFNTSVIKFTAWPRKIGTFSTLGKHLQNCLTDYHSLNIIDLVSDLSCIPPNHVSWSSAQVVSICTGLCANTTVVTLDISGCCIDTEACHAVCKMLAQNATLHHLFLNPVCLEEQEAIAMIDSCSGNATVEALSLVKWPVIPHCNHKQVYLWSDNLTTKNALQQIQKLRQENDQPLLNVYWLVTNYDILAIVIYPYRMYFYMYRKYHEYQKFKEETLHLSEYEYSITS